jgi:hypothetical protein
MRFGTSGLTLRKPFRFNKLGNPLVEPCGSHDRKTVYSERQVLGKRFVTS